MEANRSRRCRPSVLALAAKRRRWSSFEPGPLAKLFFEDSDLFLKILDDALLVAVDPAGKANEQEWEGIHTASLSHLIAPDQIQTSLPHPLGTCEISDITGNGALQD